METDAGRRRLRARKENVVVVVARKEKEVSDSGRRRSGGRPQHEPGEHPCTRTHGHSERPWTKNIFGFFLPSHAHERRLMGAEEHEFAHCGDGDTSSSPFSLDWIGVTRPQPSLVSAHQHARHPPKQEAEDNDHSFASEEGCHAYCRWSSTLPLLVRWCPHPRVRHQVPGRRDYLLCQRLQGPAARRLDPGHGRHPLVR